MTVERLEFGADGAPYHAMTAAEHMSRYLWARTLCVGKRVLDIACGEGYGSKLLSQWGAREVVGVDIARDAIRKARQTFAMDNIRYVVGDACDMEDDFLNGEKFDLICCFETIEHVDDVEGLLGAISSVRSPNSVVMISCPNDTLLPEGSPNPFHHDVFSLAQIRTRTEAVLGPARGWFLGTPIQGYSIVRETDGLEPGAVDMSAMLGGRPFGALALLPQQANIAATPETVDFFVGVWGGLPAEVAVASTLSQAALIAPWQELDALRPCVAELQNQLKGADARTAAAEQDAGELRAKLDEALANLERRTADLRRTEVVLAEERRSNAVYRARTDINHHEVRLSVGQVAAIAKEVWWERNRQTLGYKMSKAFRRLVAR